MNNALEKIVTTLIFAGFILIVMEALAGPHSGLDLFPIIGVCLITALVLAIAHIWTSK